MPPVNSGPPDGDWDPALRRSAGHFLQSSAWMAVQAALGYPVVWARDAGWSWAGAVGSRTGLAYLYVPHGPTLGAGSAGAALASVREAGRERRLHFVRVEPAGAVGVPELEAAGARRAPPVQPEHTWLLDLDVPEAQLRSQLTAGHRGSVNAAARKGLELRSSRNLDDIGAFLSLIRRTGGGRFRAQPDGYYRTLLEVLLPIGAATLYLADAGGASVAAAIGFDFGDTRYYAHAAADPASRGLSPAAPLVWRMILDARLEGRRHFDFWGVLPAPVEGHPWNGFSQFKRAFGGRLVTRIGTWEVPLSPVRHAVYRLLRGRAIAGGAGGPS